MTRTVKSGGLLECQKSLAKRPFPVPNRLVKSRGSFTYDPCLKVGRFRINGFWVGARQIGHTGSLVNLCLRTSSIR
jgi:hypothetical protein